MNNPGELNLRVMLADDLSPSLETLELFVNALQPVLAEYAQECTGENLKWDVSSLRFESIGIGVYPDRSATPLLDEPLENMSRRIVSDLGDLENGKNPRDVLPGSSYRQWSKWLKLLKSDEVRCIHVKTQEVSATLTPSGAGAYEMKLMRERVIDTLEGVIQGINFSSGTYFTLHRRSDNKAVRCHFPLEMEEQVKPLLREAVAVTGVLHVSTTDDTETLHITLPPRKIRDRSEIPRIADLLGIAPKLRIETVIESQGRTREIG